MAIIREFQDVMNQSYAGALREILARHPGTTTAELEQLVTENPGLGGLTLGELLDAKPVTRRASRKAAPRRRVAPPKPAPGKEQAWNTRTQEGRDAVDTAVFVALREAGGQQIGAEAIRAVVGVTPVQLRASLNRLIAAGKVTYSGKARGTRYSLA